MPFAAAEQAAGAADAAITVPTRVILDEDGKPEDHPAQGVHLKGAQPPLDLGVVSGALADLKPDTILVSTPLAEQRGWRVGDRPRPITPNPSQRRCGPGPRKAPR